MLSILAAAYGSVSDIELIWTLIAVIGAFFSIYNLKEAFKDFKTLGFIDRKNGRGLIARATLKSEFARLIIQLIFITIGIFAMFITEVPLPPGTPFKIVAIGFVFRWGIIISSLLITFKSYWAYQVRTELAKRLGAHNEITDAKIHGGMILMDAKDVTQMNDLDPDPHDLPPSE